ncbi:MAG TPA: hypothetical protein VH560_07780 [Polyangia bacterium]|jgi:hypothetical protein|nr:hypothetical protein [Polyangia bacterium]
MQPVAIAPTPWAPESTLRRHAAWVLVTLAYLFAFPYFERINNPNENVRIWATRAIVEHGVLNIDGVEREWGYVNDKSKNDWHMYSSKAPGTSLLGVPVLAAQTKLRHLVGWPSPSKRETTFWLRLVAVKLPLVLFLWFFAGYVERVTRSATARDLAVVGLGLGTLMYPYGQIFVGHALAAAAAFGSYMALAPPRGRDEPPGIASNRRLMLAGALAGACVMFEYQAVIVVAALSVYAVQRYRARSLSFFVGALPLMCALGLYHTALFGRPWRFPYANIENPEFLRRDHTAGFHGLALPKPAAFGSFMFSADYGLFIFSPVLALGVAAAVLVVARGPRRDGVLILALTSLMFFFLAGMSHWRAGWCVGPRYITTVAPFLAFAVVLAWPVAGERPWWSTLFAGLVIPSVLLNVVSGAVYPHYPEVFNNPVFDLTFPLLGEGYAPYSIGWLLGLRGLVSLAPLALVVLAALSLGVGGEDTRPTRWVAHVALALVVAAAVIVPLSAYGREPHPAERSATTLVQSTWEPPPAPRAPRARR